jgi:hypothetical protein
VRERRDLEPIGRDLEVLLARLGMPTVIDLTGLVADWTTVAGEPFAGMAEPVGFKDGELVLEVRDGSAASLLKYRVGPLLDRLKEHFGEGTVTRIRIRVGNHKKGL